MKTLYITDLDGTLLNSKAELSEDCKKTLNFLIDNGMIFSVATARTSATVLDMFSDVALNIPLVLMNGVLLYDKKSDKNIICHTIDKNSADEILTIFEKQGKYPMLYFQKDGYIEIIYKDTANEHQMKYINHRHDLTRKRFVYSDNLSCSQNDNLIYMVTLDKPEDISGICDDIRNLNKVTCAFYGDNYTECNFLECMNKKASKASAVLELKKIVGAERIVAFGDNLNDIPLFEIADEAYAVSNACDELKKIATGIIESNDEDAVAHFLLTRYNENKL